MYTHILAILAMIASIFGAYYGGYWLREKIETALRCASYRRAWNRRTQS
jgi:hypothetical protein